MWSSFKYSNYQKYFIDGDILIQDVDMHSIVNGRASIKAGKKSARMEYNAEYPPEVAVLSKCKQYFFFTRYKHINWILSFFRGRSKKHDRLSV